MERNNPYLDKLLRVQAELKNTQTRLDALEAGTTAPQGTVVESSKQATLSDFLSREEIQEINRSFSESLNKYVECDSLDYALACACGIISGLVDILFVSRARITI